MKNEALKMFAIAVAASLGGIATGAGMLHAQAAGEPQPVTTTLTTVAATPVVTTASRPSGPAVPGSIQVTRLTDTTFVVVKDQGDAEVVTLFSTDGGIVQKKHAGRFFY